MCLRTNWFWNDCRYVWLFCCGIFAWFTSMFPSSDWNGIAKRYVSFVRYIRFKSIGFHGLVIGFYWSEIWTADHLKPFIGGVLMNAAESDCCTSSESLSSLTWVALHFKFLFFPGNPFFRHDRALSWEIHKECKISVIILPQIISARLNRCSNLNLFLNLTSVQSDWPTSNKVSW